MNEVGENGNNLTAHATYGTTMIPVKDPGAGHCFMMDGALRCLPLIGAAVPARQFVHYVNQRVKAAIRVRSGVAKLLDAAVSLFANLSKAPIRLPTMSHQRHGRVEQLADSLPVFLDLLLSASCRSLSGPVAGAARSATAGFDSMCCGCGAFADFLRG